MESIWPFTKYGENAKLLSKFAYKRYVILQPMRAFSSNNSQFPRAKDSFI